jgi:hypothetical protein
VGAVAVAVLVVVAIVSLSGGDAIELPGLSDETPETPEFAFEAAQPRAVETAAKPQHQVANAAAQAPAKAVTQRLDDLYTAAFLDPGNWMEGSYDDVLEFFAGDARDAAEEQLDVLSAGPSAGEAFDSIRPMPSTLKVRVLIDPAGAPHAVQGSARFVARGSGTGPRVTLVSKGQFIFEKADGDWLVVAFSVERKDVESDEGPSASSSGSASAGPTESEAS